MSVRSSVVKKTAKTALRGNWCNAIIVCTAAVICWFLCLLLSECMGEILPSWAAYPLLFTAFLFIFAPVLLGAIRYFWRMIFGMKENPVAVFYYFSEKRLYLRALRVALAIGIRAAVFGFFVLLPAVIVEILSRASFYDFFHLSIPIWSANLVYLSTFLRTVGEVLIFFFLLRWFSLPFLATADEGMTIGEAVRRSAELSKFAPTDAFSLVMSFFGWFLLCLLAVPVVFVLPYFLTAASVRFRFLIAAYNKEANRVGSADSPAFEAT